MRLLIIAISLLSAQAPATLSGSYSNKELRLEIHSSATGAYTGSLELEGQTYPVTARGDATQLSGQFTVNGISFPFTARTTGNRMVLTSGGVDHILGKETVTTNPLARPSVAPLPQSPASGTMHKHSLGFTVRLAPNWTATESSEGLLLLPPGVDFQQGRNDNPEVYIAMMKADYTPADETQFVQQLSTAFTQGNGIVQRNGVRQPMNFGARSGSVYRWDIRDPQANRNIAFDVFGAPDGNRIFVFLSVGTADRVRQREAEVRQMLASMSFEAPKVSAGGPLSDSTPLAQQWLQKLRGRMIRQMYAYSGMSSDKYHYINADGTYVYRSSSMVSVDVSGASALGTDRNTSSGRWKIRDVSGRVFLQVQYQNGETKMMPITQDSRNWYLNGEKAFAVDPQ